MYVIWFWPIFPFQDRKALLESIQLLQLLTNHQTHLRDLPRKTLIDITSEVRAQRVGLGAGGVGGGEGFALGSAFPLLCS